MSSAEVKHRMLGKYGESVDEVVDLHWLRWLGYVSPIPGHFLLLWAMLSAVEVDYKETRVIQKNHLITL